MGEVLPFARVAPAEVSGLAAAGLSPALSPQFQDYEAIGSRRPSGSDIPLNVDSLAKLFTMMNLQNEHIRKLRGMIQTCFMELHATQGTLFPEEPVGPVELKTLPLKEYERLRACALAVEAALMEIS